MFYLKNSFNLLYELIRKENTMLCITEYIIINIINLIKA